MEYADDPVIQLMKETPEKAKEISGMDAYDIISDLANTTASIKDDDRVSSVSFEFSLDRESIITTSRIFLRKHNGNSD